MPALAATSSIESTARLCARPHKVTVLHQGQILSEGTMEKVKNDPKVVEVYLGR